MIDGIKYRGGRPTTTTTSSKIDPQVYTDTKSKGLTSRLVKYYENGNNKYGVTEKVIGNKTYKKFGDFPIVHIKKKDLSNNNSNIRRSSSLSCLKIASPG